MFDVSQGISCFSEIKSLVLLFYFHLMFLPNYIFCKVNFTLLMCSIYSVQMIRDLQDSSKFSPDPYLNPGDEKKKSNLPFFPPDTTFLPQETIEQIHWRSSYFPLLLLEIRSIIHAGLVLCQLLIALIA